MAHFKTTGYGSLLEKKAKQELKAPVYSTSITPPPPAVKITFAEAEQMLATGNGTETVMEKVRSDYPDIQKWETANKNLNSIQIPEEALGSDGPLGVVEIVNKISQLRNNVSAKSIEKIKALQAWVKSAGAEVVANATNTMETMESRADLKVAFKIKSLCERYDCALSTNLVAEMERVLAEAEKAEAEKAEVEAKEKAKAEEEAKQAEAKAKAKEEAAANPVSILVNGQQWDGAPVKMAPQLILAVNTEKAATTSWSGPAGFKASTKLINVPRKGTYRVDCLGISTKIKIVE